MQIKFNWEGKLKNSPPLVHRLKVKKKRKKTEPPPPRYRGSVLSSESLGASEARTKEEMVTRSGKILFAIRNKEERDVNNNRANAGYYERYGVRIYQRKYPNKHAMKNYPQVLIEPPLGWWPSKYASFKLSLKIDEFWIHTLMKPDDNPSLWLAKNLKHKVLRVPKDRKEKIKKLLQKQGLWYSHSTNLWKKRYNFDKRQEEIDAVEKGKLQENH